MGAEIATIVKYMWNGFATALPYALGGASMAAQIQAGEYAADDVRGLLGIPAPERSE